MNVLFYFILALVTLGLGSRFYSRYVGRIIGQKDDRPTPAVTQHDGRDFIPAKPHVLFGHHFSSISGAGPILGPTMGILYGFVPAWLWVVLGGIFIGAVHDFTTLFVSLQEKGRSMAQIAKRTLGTPGFALFILFTIVMIVLVTSAFLTATATALTSKWPIDKLGLSLGQTLLKTETAADGQTLGIIGGIASMSVIIITFLSPLLGYLLYVRKIRVAYAYLFAAVVCILSVWMGIKYPVRLDPETWMVILSVYVLFASGVPVWVILQPRDFINVQIMYLGIAALFLGLLSGGLGGLSLHLPAFNLAEGTKNLGLIWPMLFITVACGAISGFHALVASGTSSKQLASEKHARTIGYNGMLLESVLAVCVLLVVGSAFLFPEYKSLVWPEVGRSNPILAFSLGVGKLLNGAFSIPIALGSVFGILMVEGFVVTTLDTAVRLNRYLFEELWGLIFKKVPGLLKKFWFNSALAVALMWLLAYFNTFAALWPIFGTANQLLAALSLIAVSTWLSVRGRKNLITVIPAVFMILTTTASLLILLFTKYIPQMNVTLLVADILLLVLSLGVIYLSLRTMLRLMNEKKQKGKAGDERRSASARRS
ncbi:MAG: carbon starvation protein A [Candidatus Zixiibacteriota bacterium]|nr:MAG: carbon starvation protein A [candidate division Zixibacteria bacterium]